VKKICMVCQSYYLRDPRVRREAEALADAGFMVDIITLRDKGEKRTETVSGVNIYRLPIMRKREGVLRYLFEYLFFFLFSSVLLTLLFIRKRYNLIQVHTMPDFLIFCSLVPRIFGAKAVLDVHEPMPELFMSKYGLKKSNFFIKILRFQEKVSLVFSNHIITIHQPLKDLFIKRNNINKKKISIVLNIPDTKIFSTAGKKRSSKKEKNFVLIYTGTIAERYGLDVAVRGISSLKYKIPRLKLMIIGEGEHLNYIKELVLKLNLGEYVEFYDPVPIDRIPDFIEKADLGISTHKKDSFWDLYFSTKIVEFLISGLPVVSSKTKTIQYYFSEDDLFYFTPEREKEFAEKVLLTYRKPSLAEKKVENARKNISENMSWDKEKIKFAKLIESLI
jgi:glycosyltransferase involved in cell wall biosynthesis